LTAGDALFVSESQKKKLNEFRAGVSLESRTGYTVDDIVDRATLDRIGFGVRLLKSAQRLLRARPPEYRQTTSRGYYAMYHIMRSVVFFVVGGDDHEKHSELPDHIPPDFPNHAMWQNRLKNARLERNRADYEPYPSSDKGFETAARTVVSDTEALLPVARAYLRRKGCTP
jgi:uncharacterized protein (UPF0332 family)